MSFLKKNIVLLYLIVSIFSFYSCKKYLDAKPDSKLVVPTEVSDLQSVLDYYIRVNNLGASPAESSADNYYLTDADWKALTNEGYRRMFIWEKDFLFTTYPNTWSQLYDVVNIANTTLFHLNQIKQAGNDNLEWNNVKGQALFLRAQSFLQAASIWCLVYNEKSASSDLGIPLRLDPDFNKPSKRSSVKETYDQILIDLKTAIPLLPDKPLHVLRASKPAVYGLLARTYLFMGDFNNALLYADSCLHLKSDLIDYNTLSSTKSFPFKRFNEEVIVDNFVPVPPNLSNARAKIDPDLYNSYTDNDLRKALFFKKNSDGSVGFKGSYEESGALFGGVATDEMYLTKAECLARQGKYTEGMEELNFLLKTRWSNKVSYIALTASGSTEALELILKERRKELLYRCLRWMDIKRYNKDGANITLTRNINGQNYSLKPNDLRYALPIPEDIINLTGIMQNLR